MTEQARRRARRAGIVAGSLAAAVGAAVAAERLFVRRERRRPDPDALEPFGRLRGRSFSVESFDGTELHVEELGDGPLLVFVHGFSLELASWHYQIRDLSADFRLVLYDQRGHGKSGMPPGGDFTLGALAQDLEAVLRATAGAEPAVVIGHSMGGMTALTFAEMFPDAMPTRVGGLVLVDTTAADLMGGMLPGAARRFRAIVQTLQEAAMGSLAKQPERLDRIRGGIGGLGYLVVRGMGFGPKPSPAQVAFVEEMLAATPSDVWISLVPSLMGLDVEKVLDSISVPVLIVVGTHDRLTPSGAAERLARAIQGAELAVIEDAGHMAMLERPHTFNARLRAFVVRHGLAGDRSHGRGADPTSRRAHGR